MIFNTSVKILGLFLVRWKSFVNALTIWNFLSRIMSPYCMRFKKKSLLFCSQTDCLQFNRSYSHNSCKASWGVGKWWIHLWKEIFCKKSFSICEDASEANRNSSSCQAAQEKSLSSSRTLSITSEMFWGFEANLNLTLFRLEKLHLKVKRKVTLLFWKSRLDLMSARSVLQTVLKGRRERQREREIEKE